MREGHMNGAATQTDGRVLAVEGGTGRRLASAAAVAAGLLALSAAVAPPAGATPGNLAGTWASVDVDGSNQTLRIKGAGKPVYAISLRDDFTSGACGGPPAKLVGHAVANGNELSVTGTLVCLHGGNPIPGERVSSSMDYNAATDTLIDSSGIVWNRTG
jgi:hypothetical protein